MNEHEFERAFRAWSQAEAAEPASATLRVRVLDVPLTTRQGRGRWAWIEVGRFGSMFSATKFVVAGAIVALFGGFLLAGYLPLQPSHVSQPAAVSSATASPQAGPTTTPSLESSTAPEAVVRTDLVAGAVLTVEETAPGIYRVLDDGAGHDLLAPMSAVLPIDDAGGLFIVSDPRGSMFRLGGSGSASWERGWSSMSASTKVAADGTVWAMRDSDHFGQGALYRFDGATWIEQPLPDQNDPDGVLREAGETAFAVTPDGRVWVALSRDPALPIVAVLQDGEWTTLPSFEKVWERNALGDRGLSDGGHDCCGLAVESDGTIWLTDDHNLLRYDDGQWQLIKPKVAPNRRTYWAAELAVGPDDTLWVKGGCGTPSLARHDQDGWEVWEDLMEWDGCAAYGATMTPARDGILWLRFGGNNGRATERLVKRGIVAEPSPGPGAWLCGVGEPAGDPGDNPGVLSFDGTRWHQYLAGNCPSDVAVAADGSVWVTDGGAELGGTGAGLYVITLEAAMAGT